MSPHYGKGVVLLDVEELDFADTGAVVERLTSVFKSPDYSPPRMPETALKLLQLTKGGDVAVSQITRVLEEDQLLAAEVLRIAQSAQYQSSTGNPIQSLDEAIVRLGLRRATEVFLQASINMRVFRVSAYQKHMDQLQKHSALVAQLARIISRETALYDEHAFLCGLLHDVGIAASLIAFADGLKKGEPAPEFSRIWPAIAAAHEEAGGTLATLWGLPPELGYTFSHHHHFMVGKYPHPTAAVIELSNSIAEDLGCGFHGETAPAYVSMPETGLGLSHDAILRARSEAAELISKMG